MPATIGSPRPNRTDQIAATGESIRTEIAGTVLQLSASVGDHIAEGGTVALLESMKMEIPVIAESTGTITHILVAPGDTVAAEDVIAVTAAVA